MNAHDLLDYHLRQLDRSQCHEVESHLAEDSKLSERSRQLGERLSLLLDMGDVPDPPPGLVGRTLFRVLEEQKASTSVLSMPAAAAKSEFRWSDLAVAAVVLIAGLGTLLPAIGHSRQNSLALQCGNNLMHLGQSLQSYAFSQGKYPEPVSRTAPIASYIFPLLESKYLTSSAMLACPGAGYQPASISDARWETWRNNPENNSPDFQQFSRHTYSYNPGHRLNGAQTTPLTWQERMVSNQPLAADGPGLDAHGQVLPGNSPNHGGRSQFVLFTDGAVRRLRTRSLAKDRDIYLNDRNQLGAGLHAQDSVLYPGSARLQPGN